MTEIVPLAQMIDAARGGVISIGNFDGVHRGHASLLGEVRRQADQLGGPAVAVVLDPHPSVILRPHSAPPRLTTISRRAELMTPLGIDYLVVCETTQQFLNRTAEEFFEFLIRAELRTQAMVEGPNFFFGRDRGGDVARLKSLCEAAGIGLSVVQPKVDEDRMISSSRIREAIAAGQIERANEMLGSTYRLQGRVVAGDGRGRTLGFPTANLADVESMMPGHGVYAAVASIPADSSLSADSSSSADGSSSDLPAHYAAAVHVGANPTFDDRTSTKLEVHLLDYAGDLYDRTLSVDLLAWVREVKRFADADQLMQQLHRDIGAIRKLA